MTANENNSRPGCFQVILCLLGSSVLFVFGGCLLFTSSIINSGSNGDMQVENKALEAKEDESPADQAPSGEEAQSKQHETLLKIQSNEKRHGKYYGNCKNFYLYNVRSSGRGAFSYIYGTMVNDSENSYGYVQITAQLFDKDGAVVGSSMTNINNIGPGSVWKFKIPCLEKYSKFEITTIDGF